NLGGGSTYDKTTGEVTAPSYTVQSNPNDATTSTTVNNVGAAIDSLNTAVNTPLTFKDAASGSSTNPLGSELAIVGDSNITTTVTQGQAAIALNKDLNLTSITAGNSLLNTNGLTITGGPSITTAGIDAAGTSITNIKGGEVSLASKDAINGSQLYGTYLAMVDALGGSSSYNPDGTVTPPTYAVNGTDYKNVGAAISALDTGWVLNANGQDASAIKAGDTVDIGTADTEENLTVSKTGNKIDFALNKDLKLSTVTATDTVTVGIGSNAISINGTTGTLNGLANKTWDSSKVVSGQAATEDQLKSATTYTTKDGNGNDVQMNISNIVVNQNVDDKNQDSLFLTYNKAGQNTTDRLTIAQTVSQMNRDGIKYFHTNADTSSGSLGVTNDSSAGGLDSTAIGVNAIIEAGADGTLALGLNTKALATATASVVIGQGSIVQGASSIAIGDGAQALGNQSISIGTGNVVTGNRSGAIGDPNNISGNDSYALGNNNTVTTNDTFVVGNNITQTVDGSVVLGTGSAATTGAGQVGYSSQNILAPDLAAINATSSTTGAVAVGDANKGVYRQITGVAAGTANSDAVNVAQLKAVDNQVGITQNALVNGLGGNAKVNTDGTITGPTYNVTGNTQTNVGDALNALDKALADTTGTANAGWTVKAGNTTQVIKANKQVEFEGDQNVTVSQANDADGNAKLTVALNKKLDLEEVKTGDTIMNNSGVSIGQTVQLNNTGLIIVGGPSVTTGGISAGNKAITNVADGVNTSDAVNKGQLDSAVNNIQGNIDKVTDQAVQYNKNADGTVDKNNVTLAGGSNGTKIGNVADGTLASGSKDAVNGGQLADVRDNLQGQITNNTNDINSIKNDINSGSVGLVQQAGKDADITVAKDTGGSKVNMSGTSGDRVVTGVANGAVSSTSKDAVNGSQLNATNDAVVKYLGGGAGYDNITGSFTAPSYTVGDSKHDNVGGAIDALNKADQTLNSKIDNVSTKLDDAFRVTNDRIDSVEKKANAGIAAAMALESAPYIAGKYTYAAGASYHGGENAIGVTLRKTADNGRWSITGGVAAASQGDPSVRIGISGVID
ncbi:YadA-like family protein, partial [Acinetobacter sp. ANC 3832]|uniref:YadA-like family protein n=1 Tax=Acinetobacter sp. ANC 3832 TaxID=1977874 RepID=UPI002AE07211